jgi:GNAT superfamily N-acetyltransferase
MPRLELVRTTSDAPAAVELTEQLEAELVERYGPGGGASMPRRKAEDYLAFVVALADDVPAACGGVYRHDATRAEVHRMYTRPALRGNGYGAQVLAELERAAAEAGCTEMVLETGTLNPEAVALYQRVGYARIPAFGPYADTPHSLCFGRSLSG